MIYINTHKYVYNASLSNLYYSAEARAKYFFLIDTQRTWDLISASRELKDFKTQPEDPSKIEALMDCIFNTIFLSDNLYTDYINPDGNNYGKDFMGHAKPASLEELRVFRSMLALCLRNHCIMHYYLSYMRTKDKAVVDISNPNDIENKTGYYHETVNDIPDTSYASPTAASISGTKKRLLHSYEESASYSPKLLLHTYTIADKNQKGHLSVPHLFSAAYDFLFYTRAIHSIDDILVKASKDKDFFAQNSILWENYSALDLKYRERPNGSIPISRNSGDGIDKDQPKKHDVPGFVLSGVDLLLYSAPFEYWYGFSSFRYIYIHINKKDDTPKVITRKGKHYKRIDDRDNNTKPITLNSFSETDCKILCSLFLECPMVYSRHFFMEYALFAATNSADGKSSYLTQDVSSIGNKFQEREKSPSEYRTGPMFDSIYQYWHMLNKITIPVLEDMWTVCMKNLEDYMSETTFDMENMYKSYIDKNIDMLTADFTAIPASERKSLFITPATEWIEFEKKSVLKSTSDIEFKYANPKALKRLQQKYRHPTTRCSLVRQKRVRKPLPTISSICAPEKLKVLLEGYKNSKTSNVLIEKQSRLKQVPETAFKHVNLPRLKELLKKHKTPTNMKHLDTTPKSRSFCQELLCEYLSIDSKRFKEDLFMPGYINYKRDQEKPNDILLEDYFKKILLARISLFNEQE